MKIIKPISLLILLISLILLPQSSNAFVLDNPDSGIQMWIPDNWKHKTEGEDLEIFSPDEELSMVVTLLEANDVGDAMTEGLNKIKEAVGNINLGESQEGQINGMNMLSIDGDAMNGQMKISMAIIQTPINRICMIFAFATVSAAQRYDYQLGKILQGIKPSTSIKTSSKNLFAPSPAPAPVPTQSIPPVPWAIGDTFYIEGKRVSLRAQPDTKSRLIARLGYSDFGEVIGTGPREKIGKMGYNYWIKVRVKSKGIVGWVYGFFLRGEGGC